jgi:hypothetical protein
MMQLLVVNLGICGSSSVGRASAFQAECREFEPRLPLHKLVVLSITDMFRKIRSNKLFRYFITAHVAQAVERFLGKEEVHRFESDHGLHNMDMGKNYSAKE